MCETLYFDARDRQRTSLVIKWLALVFTVIAFSPTPIAVAQTPADAADQGLQSDAFVAAQHALSTKAEDALEKLAARFANGDGPIAALEKDREQDVAQRALAEAHYIALLGVEGDRAQSERDQAARDRDRLDAKIVSADQQIAKLDPAYAEMRRPLALTIPQTQALLKPKEALLLPKEALLLIGPEEDGKHPVRAAV
jgi:hypothetical protein